MKKASIWSILLALCITSTALAANLATISIQNDGFTEKFKYSIDIYAISDEDDFGVGDTTIALQFNDVVLSNWVLSNQNPLFHNNADYAAMSIATGGIFAANQIGLVITLTGVSATLPDTDTRLATITFDIDPTPAVYRAETTDLAALVGLSSMTSSPPAGPVFIFWTDSINDALICTPEISGSPITVANVNSLYDFTPITQDVCQTSAAGNLSFSITNQPMWTGAFDTNSGQLTGTPLPTDAGITTNNVLISVTDPYGDSSSLPAYNIFVSGTCTAPLIRGVPNTTVSAGAFYSFTPTVNNGCGVLTYSIVHQPSWANFDPSTGELSGTPAAGDVGTTNGIVISVEDATPISASLAAFNIQVTAATSPASSSGGGSGSGGGGGGCFVSSLLTP